MDTLLLWSLYVTLDFAITSSSIELLQSEFAIDTHHVCRRRTLYTTRHCILLRRLLATYRVLRVWAKLQQVQVLVGGAGSSRIPATMGYRYVMLPQLGCVAVWTLSRRHCTTSVWSDLYRLARVPHRHTVYREARKARTGRCQSREEGREEGRAGAKEERCESDHTTRCLWSGQQSYADKDRLPRYIPSNLTSQTRHYGSLTSPLMSRSQSSGPNAPSANTQPTYTVSTSLASI